MLRAALEQGSDPEKAIASLRERNLSLQEERSRLLRGLGLPADWLTNRPMCEKCGDTGYEGAATCECVKRRYARLLKQQLSSVLPIEDQNFEKFNLSYYSPRIDPNMHDLTAGKHEGSICLSASAYARNFGENSPNLLLYGSRPTRQDLLHPRGGGGGLRRGAFGCLHDTAINIIAAYETIKFGNGDGAAAAERAARYERADLLIIDDMGTEMGTAFTVSALHNPHQQPPDGASSDDRQHQSVARRAEKALFACRGVAPARRIQAAAIFRRRYPHAQEPDAEPLKIFQKDCSKPFTHYGAECGILTLSSKGSRNPGS
ncbi:MAG: hypothetical protein ACLR4Z_18995 [Butyricicoccaceae bacterium]